MFIYGKEAMEITRETALDVINEIIFGLDAPTSEEKVHTITGTMMLLNSLGQRFADKEENNDAT